MKKNVLKAAHIFLTLSISSYDGVGHIRARRYNNGLNVLVMEQLKFLIHVSNKIGMSSNYKALTNNHTIPDKIPDKIPDPMKKELRWTINTPRSRPIILNHIIIYKLKPQTLCCTG